MNTPKSKVVIKVEKEEKPSSHNEIQNSSLNGELDKLSVDKEEITPYEKKYFSLLTRVEIIKQSNERLINRIYHVKKLLRRRKKERKFLMERLDGYGDEYRTAATSLFSEINEEDGPPRNSQVINKNESSSSGILQMDLDL